MSISPFTKTDFEVFYINGLEERMEALKQHIRPKLEELGRHFAPSLSVLTGDELFPHVAKHARRTKNPPNDTWVAFSSNPRGYKMLPHFQIGLWGSHLFIWFAVIYEAAKKEKFGQLLHNNVLEIMKDIPDDFVWSPDHTKPEAKLHGDLSKKDFIAMFARLQTVKKAEILCGYHIPKLQAIQMDASELIEKIDFVFKKLIPLYRLSFNNN
ncbi:DUF1054 domain-containing protein [Bacillus aquiflavi]|uniref:YktB family protein n=1 Tax=Bacillus aquiflavi TaxID=2672567 RepID=UPI001CA986A6|nr:DUF1054 domain-containing protein [Bacillus aquiflavi]UAC49252.1 DUF1054 domain-containing protein [Bacillus aquiflavi]